jgi:hypothetical protein
VIATFAGDPTHASSDASADFVVTPRPTTLSLTGTLGNVTHGTPLTIAATLEAVPDNPLHQRTVFVIIRGTEPANSGVTRVFTDKTDPEGRIHVPSSLLATLPAGNYNVDAYFNGVNVPGLEVPPDSPEYAPATAHATLTLWAFTGFFSPVDNPPTINQVKAGQSIPVKFSLGGDRGLEIFQAGYPKVATMSCPSGVPTDPIEEAASSGNSGLQYDPVTNRYTYVWKTQKGWTGCRTLILRFLDGTERTALFKFTK